MKSTFQNFSFALALITHVLSQLAFAGSYNLDDVVFPADMPPEIGDLAFAADGTLYAALRRGDIVVATPTKDPTAFQWRVFATGHHNILGLEVVKPGHLVVSQMAVLTEVIDTDGDGVADRYNNLSTAWGVSGNYHETNALCPDGDGGYYIAVGTASHNGPTFDTPRGDYSTAGRRGRDFSAVKYKGWVLHYAKDGTVTPHCSGFRMHNGIARTTDGMIWCGDNQGDWRGASPLYWCREGSFSGHPASLVWDPRFKDFGTPIYWPRKLLDDLHNEPAIMMAHGEMRSCGEPMQITTDNFGPFKGQMLIPDENSPRIMRVMLETVDGAWQGANVLFHTGGLRPSGNRMAMSPDGKTLYYGETARGWQKPNEGIHRLHYTGTVPFEVLDCKLTTGGFAVSFTQPIQEPSKLASQLTVRSFRYEYGYHYGSKQKSVREHAVTAVSGNGPYEFTVADLQPGRVYELTFANVLAADGSTIGNPKVTYTMNRLKRPPAQNRATIKQSDNGLKVFINGEFFTEYFLRGFTNPILWPIQAPGDIRMTRNWPIIADTAGEQHDHPHHKGLFVGHQNLNGVDFWHEGKGINGRMNHTRLIETRSGEDRALIKTLNTWTTDAGKTVAADTRTLTFWGDESARYIDLEINIHATHEDLLFHEMKDSFVGFRSHPHLRVTAKPKAGVTEVYGHVVNSEGVTGKAVWGKRADWVHYHGQVEGKDAGYAFMSHPGNPSAAGQKSWWHARDYGLISANPFAPEKFQGDGDHTIAKGDSLQLRYRFVFHRGPADSANIAEAFAAYTTESAHPTADMPGHPGYPGAYGNPKPKGVQAQKKQRRSAPQLGGGTITKAGRSVSGKQAKRPKILANGLVEGTKIFGDRAYTFTVVPESARGADYLQTFNNDKKGANAHYELTLSAPAELLVLMDTRAEAHVPWLKDGFEKTNEIVQTDADFRFRVYRKRVNPGAVTLGPQKGFSFYGVAAIKQKD